MLSAYVYLAKTENYELQGIALFVPTFHQRFITWSVIKWRNNSKKASWFWEETVKKA